LLFFYWPHHFWEDVLKKINSTTSSISSVSTAEKKDQVKIISVVNAFDENSYIPIEAKRFAFDLSKETNEPPRPKGRGILRLL
jgi:hypothetical protein